MKKILLVEGNLKEANQEFTENGIKTTSAVMTEHCRHNWKLVMQ